MQTNPVKYLLLPVWVIAILAFGALMHYAAEIFVWLVSSFFLLALLDPWFLYLLRRRVPVVPAALLLIFCSALVSSGLIFLMVQVSTDAIIELQESKKTLIQYYDSLTLSLKSLINTFSHSPLGTPSNLNHIPKVEVVQSSPLSGTLGNTLMHGLGSAMTIVTYAFLCPILTFFLMAERSSLKRIVPLAFKNPVTCGLIWQKIVDATRAFFIGNLFLAIVTYPVFVILFFSFGVKSAFTLAALSSILNLVPFLGAVLAGFLPALELISQGNGAGAGIFLYAFCVVIHMIVANFATPKLLGAKVDINATFSTIALLAWGELWGAVGIILAIPIMAAIKITFEHSGHPWLHWIAALMSQNMDRSLERTVGYQKKDS